MSKPTKAQLRILGRIADGEEMSVNAWGTVFIHPRERLAETVPDRTVAALKRGGWVSSVQLPNARPHYVLTHAGQAEVSIAAGAHRIAWPCGECGVLQPIQVKTYREIQREGCGICCFTCAAKAFVAGGRARRLAASQAPDAPSLGE